MATNQTQTPAVKAQRPIIGVSGKGRRAPIATDPKAAEKNGERPKVDFAAEKDLVAGLVDAVGFHRDALNVEMAVSLVYYTIKGVGADKSTKLNRQMQEGLRAIYKQAGYQVDSPKGEDYKTVQRRMGASFELYKWIGGAETVTDWLRDSRPKVQVAEAAKKVGGYNLQGINSILALVGKGTAGFRAPRSANASKAQAPAAPAAPAPAHTISAEAAALPGHAGTDGVKTDDKEPKGADAALAGELEAESKHRRAEDRLPEDRVIVKGPLHIGIPLEASYEDVIAAAMELMKFAQNMREHAASAAKH